LITYSTVKKSGGHIRILCSDIAMILFVHLETAKREPVTRFPFRKLLSVGL